jgi:hypothetical protein
MLAHAAPPLNLEFGWTLHPEAFGLAEPGLLLLSACNFRAIDEIESQFHQRASVYNLAARAVK